MIKNKILLIDDDRMIRVTIREFLTINGFDILEAPDCATAKSLFIEYNPDIVISDYVLPDGNALELLLELREYDPFIPVIILTGHGSIELAVRAIKEGANHFITKPVELDALLVITTRLLEQQRVEKQQKIKNEYHSKNKVDPFVGQSKVIKSLQEHCRKTAEVDFPVLLQGETGSGKSLIARWIHEHSPRANELFVDLNCSNLSETFLDSELFGHDKGAFTGAIKQKPGLLEIANNGTVFLDEIGDMSLTIQPKLLKFLEEKKFRRLGDIRDKHTDVRLIAATHQDLKKLVNQGKFRADLYFRISTLPISIPPLRERKTDIPVLAESIIKRIANDLGQKPRRLSQKAVEGIQSYGWPGNIRELRNVLEHSVLLCDQAEIDLTNLRLENVKANDQFFNSVSCSLHELELNYIKTLLLSHKGSVSKVAKILKIPRSSLYQKIKRFQLDLSELKTGVYN